MRTLVRFVLALATVGCVAGPPGTDPETVYGVGSSIVVTPSDLSGRRYTILGNVEWPQAGYMVYRPLLGEYAPCDPWRIREEAVRLHGNRVDAVIGFQRWSDGREEKCSGTAVEFVDEPAKVPVPSGIERSPEEDGILAE